MTPNPYTKSGGGGAPAFAAYVKSHSANDKVFLSFSGGCLSALPVPCSLRASALQLVLLPSQFTL